MKLDIQKFTQNLVVLLIAVLTAYNTWQANKNAATLHEVHVLANSAMEATQRSLAEVSAAKAAITHDPADKAAAEKAMADYLAHVKKQSELNK